MRAESPLQRLNERHEAGDGVRPSVEAWYAVMNCWVNSKRPQVIERVVAIVKLVEDLAERSHDIELSPILYTILQKYRQGEVQLATRTFNIGLNAITSLNRPDAERKAIDALTRMKQYCQTDPSVTPSLRTYNIILKALSRSHTDDAAERAETLLNEMDAMPGIDPDAPSYLTCIIAWGRSNRSDKFERVMDLLNRFISAMENGDGYKIQRESIAVFNAVLSVCHHNSSAEFQASSVRTSIIAMEKLRSSKRAGLFPDQTTYSSFFRVFRDVHEGEFPGCETRLEEEFRSCVKDGCVTMEIVKIVAHVAPHILKQHAKTDFDSKTFVLPKSWSRNAMG
ncbi:MAG: hypothetical protein SGARI_001347 [Bacillariaceae sp.]